MIPNIPLICTIIAIIACFYASYTDLKSRTIPNKLTLPLIGLGIALNAVYAFMINDIWFIIGTALITAGTFSLCYIFWRFKAWAGGDVKLFTALAALLPFYPAAINYNIFGVGFPILPNYVFIYQFPLTVIINSILSTLPFLLIVLFYIAVRKKPYLMDELIAPVRGYRKNIVLTLVITSAVTLTVFITSYFNLNSYLQYQIIIVSLILVYLLTFTISKLPNRLKAVVVSLIIVFGLYNNFNNLPLMISGMIGLLVMITAIEIIKILITSVNKKALQDDYEIFDLKEGMILAHNVYELNEEVYFDDKSALEKIRESIENGDLSNPLVPKGKLLINAMTAGLTDQQIKLLTELFNENKIKNKVKIKRGLPFTPSILIGLIISIIIGDLAFILQKILYVILY